MRAKGGRSPTVVAAKEEPILASDRDPTQASLGTVIVYFQITVPGVPDQGLPI